MNSEAIRFVETEWQVQFPENTPLLLRRFEREISGECGFRIMTLDEVLEAQGRGSAESDFAVTQTMIPLWSDGESNYAALGVEEPLEGKISFLDHEQSFDFVPVFRNGLSFLESLKECRGGEWWDIPLDYPQDGTERLRIADPSALGSDWEVVQRLYEKLRTEQLDERKRAFFCCAIIVMTPPEMASTLIPFLDSADERVCAKACCICGARRVQAAAPKLAQIARSKPKLLRYVLDGLGLMRTEESLRIILDLHQEFPRHKASFARALELYGWTVQGNPDWNYLDPRTGEWKTV